VVPLALNEPATLTMLKVLAEDHDQWVWWGTPVECASALARVERAGGRVDQAFDRLDEFARAWREIAPSQAIRRTAQRLLRTHPLRAADAFQLAAAIIVAEGAPRSLPFVTLDSRLAQAAAREGFPVIGE
jgi:predicted nucleic acid-binding protein